MKLKPYPKYKDSGVEWMGEIPFLQGNADFKEVYPSVTAKASEKRGMKVSIMPEEATINAMLNEIINFAVKK